MDGQTQRSELVRRPRRRRRRRPSRPSEKDVYWKYIPLYQAALRGDWSSAETFFRENEGSLTARINEYSETPLHVAAGAGKSIDFVKKLVDKILEVVPGNTISEEAMKKLEIGDQYNCTPLHIAAWAGNNDVVEFLLGKRRSLIYMRDNNKRSALDLAARNAKKDTLNYLLKVSEGDPLSTLFPKDVSTPSRQEGPTPVPTFVSLRPSTTSSTHSVAERHSESETPSEPSEAERHSESETPSEPVPGIVETPSEPIPGIVETPSEPVPGIVETPSEPVPGIVETPSEPVPGIVETPSEPGIVETPSEPVPGIVETPSEPVPSIVETPSVSIYDENSAAALLVRVITSGFYDIALYLVERFPELAFVKREKDGDCGLKALARKVSAFKSGSHYKWWQRLIYAFLVKLDDCTTSHHRGDIETGDNQTVTRHKYNWARLLVERFCTFVPCMKNIQAQKKMHHQALELVQRLCKGVRSLNDSDAYNLRAKDALLTAAKLGIPEVIEEIVESFPNLLWAEDEDSRLNIFHIAVVERHVNVFNLIYQMGDYRQILVRPKDDFKNNLLHYAGKLGPNKNNRVSGAALQMQRELQWFQEVKKFANPRDIDSPNNFGDTPPVLFTKNHELLRAEGEKWMKETANSCTIPAALIVTVVFAAAITVPGGIHGTNGLPILSKEVVFNIFAVSNAISLFAAITSLLVSLSILTCRYAERDFLVALPNRLIIGLITLFLSITAMVIAFSSALYLMFGNKERAWILYPVAALACIPIISFAFLQLPLLVDLMVATYGPRIFGKQSNRPFY